MIFNDLKRNSKKSLKKNYITTLLVATVGLFFLSLYGYTNNSLLYGFECVQNFYDNGHFAPNLVVDFIDSGLYKEGDLDYDYLYTLSDEELAEQGYNESAIRFIHSLNPNYDDKTTLVERLKVRDGIAKPILSFLSTDLSVLFDSFDDISFNTLKDKDAAKDILVPIGSILAIIIYRIFISNALTVGYARFFLENSKYHKTTFERIFYSFKYNYFRTIFAMIRKTIYQLLWDLTIVGGIIKAYSYKLVPFIIAEDNTISSKEAIKLSVQLMKGYKFKAFLLDLSFIGWNALSYISLGLVGLLFTDPYKEGTNAEFYKELVTQKRLDEFYQKYLNGRKYADEELYTKKDKDYYPGTEPQNNEFVLQTYTPLTLFFLFFFFSFIGWLLEVSLFLLKTHTYVNRGTLYGPWLPIYGSGCVLILIFFTKTRLKKYIKYPILNFTMIMILCGALEYFSSWFLEVTTHLKYWDYAGHFLSINGRICFENLCEFGIGGMICLYIFAPKINKILENYNKKRLNAIVALFLLFFLLDSVYSKIYPRTGYGITDAIIDEKGNLITKNKT